MASQLKNILNFSIPNGGTLALPHNLNWSGIPKIPDNIVVDGSGFEVTADETNVTVTGIGDVNVLVESWHTIERAFGDETIEHLTPQPFVVTSSGGLPTPAFDVATITIYARPTGSDTTGDGLSPATAYATMQRAVRDIPLNIPPGAQYIVDISGVNEVLPSNYTLPAWKAPFTQDTSPNPPGFQFFTAAVKIQATPIQSTIATDGDGIINFADVLSQVALAGSSSGLIVLTLNPASPNPVRATWANNALRGEFLIAGPVGAGTNCMIVGSTTTQLLLTNVAAIPLMSATVPPVNNFPAVISQPGATIRGDTLNAGADAGGYARGCMRAINVDSLLLSGLDIANTLGLTSPGFASGGNGTFGAQLCKFQSPEIVSNSPASGRITRSWVTGAPLFRSNGGPIIFLSAFADQWTAPAGFAGNFVGSGACIELRASYFNACAPLQIQSGQPGAPGALEGNVQCAWLLTSAFINGTPGATGDGFLFTGGSASLLNVDVNGCHRDGIRAADGAGWMHLDNLSTYTGALFVVGAPNTENGLNVQDGQRVAATALTYNSVNPLTGTAAAISVGGVVSGGVITPALTAATWNPGFTGAPFNKNMFDIQSVAGTGATGSGSQLYGD